MDSSSPSLLGLRIESALSAALLLAPCVYGVLTSSFGPLETLCMLGGALMIRDALGSIRS